MFNLTTKDGQFTVTREASRVETAPFDAVITFEQDPNQILDALLPLYMNSQVPPRPAAPQLARLSISPWMAVG